jgi:aspartate/methionine/tyrosine aminotransferase
VAGYYAARGIEVSPERLILTSGTSEAYAHLFRLLCDPGEEMLVPQPSYPLLEPIARLEGVRLTPYRLEWQGRWALDIDALRSAATDATRGVVVVQPNHPTGSCLDAAERVVVEQLCERRGLAIVSDEVFGDFPWPPRGGAPGDAVAARGALPSLLERPRVLTFVASGLSKVCGLPQLKLSWIAVDGPALERDEALRGLEWIADLFLSVAAPVQEALPALLAARHEYQAQVRVRIAANRARLAGLVDRCPEIQFLEAEGGWVAVLRMPSRMSDEEWALELLCSDVVVHPGHFYDFAEPWHLVISLIVEESVMAEALERIAGRLESSCR